MIHTLKRYPNSLHHSVWAGIASYSWYLHFQNPAGGNTSLSLCYDDLAKLLNKNQAELPTASELHISKHPFKGATRFNLREKTSHRDPDAFRCTVVSTRHWNVDTSLTYTQWKALRALGLADCKAFYLSIT